MGLLSILRKLRLKEKEMRILVLGLDNAGKVRWRALRGKISQSLMVLSCFLLQKTTVMKRLNGEPTDEIAPTLGFRIETLQCGYGGSFFRRYCRKVAIRNSCAFISAILFFVLLPCSVCREYKLNCWDIGGQRSLRSYWRNYFEQTDGLLWVVDSADRERIDVCREELQRLLLEEKLAGATLLVLANKQDLTGRLAPEELQAALAIDTISAARHCRVQACSAYTGEGLEAGIEWLVADIAERIFTLD